MSSNSIPIHNTHMSYTSSTADETNVTIVSFGSADAGKSTLLSLLSLFIILNKENRNDPDFKMHIRNLVEKLASRNPKIKEVIKKVAHSEKYDDANGLLRNAMARHNHEITSRHTSDLNSIPIPTGKGKTVTIIDVCGQETYMKTTVRGMSDRFPDNSLGVISTQSGVTEITRSHFEIVSMQNIPIMLVITHIDTSQKRSYRETMEGIKEMCRITRQQPLFINRLIDYKAWQYANTGKVIGPNGIEEQYDVKNFQYKTVDEFIEKDKKDLETILKYWSNKSQGKQTVIPVVTVSCVNGYGIKLVHDVISLTPPRDIWDQNCDNNRMIKLFQTKLGITEEQMNIPFNGSIFYIDNPWKKEGLPGVIVSGIHRGEPMKIGDRLFLGPFDGKEFAEVEIKSMHNNNQESIDVLNDHDRGCCRFTIITGTKTRKDMKNKLKKREIRKGFCIVTKNHIDDLCWTINVAAVMFHSGSINIRPGWQPVLNIGNIQQTASVQRDETFQEEIDENGKKHIVKKIDIKGTGSIINLKFKFVKNPELVLVKSQLSFRSGKVHGIGYVTSIVPLSEDPEPYPQRSRKFLKNIKVPPTHNGTFNMIDIKL